MGDPHFKIQMPSSSLNPRQLQAPNATRMTPGAQGQELTGQPGDLIAGIPLGDRQVSAEDQESAAQTERVSQLHQAISSFQPGEDPNTIQILLNQILEQDPSFQTKESLALALAQLGGGIQNLQLPDKVYAALIELMVDLVESESVPAANAGWALWVLYQFSGLANSTIKSLGSDSPIYPSILALIKLADALDIDWSDQTTVAEMIEQLALGTFAAAVNRTESIASLVECAEHVPDGFPRYGALIGQVRRLFNRALDNPNPAIAPAVFGALCALCAKVTDPNIASAALKGCIDSLPQDFPNYDALIGQVRDLFYGALDNPNPHIAPAAFGALCALCARTHDHDFGAAAILGAFGAAVGALEGQTRSVTAAPLDETEAHDAAWQAFGAFAAILGECIGHVPNEFCGEFIDAIRGRFAAAADIMSDETRDIGNRFAGMRIAHELLKFWSMLQVRGVAERSRDTVLEQVVEALNQSGRCYFSCRGDAEWRRMHTAPAVFAILARTDLALSRVPPLGTIDRCEALSTLLRGAAGGVGRRTCDAITQLEYAIGDAGRAIRIIIAEMQQKEHRTGKQDNLLERLREYIQLADNQFRTQLGAVAQDVQFFGIGYRGYGTRGTLVREGNAATLAIGAPMVVGEGEGPEARQLIEGRIRGFRDAIADRLRRARLPADAIQFVVDVVTVIGTSHVLTFEIFGNLGLHPDAQALCNFLRITKEHMEARLEANDGQANALLGEGFMRLPEEAQARVSGEGNAELWQNSKMLMGDMVRISEGLFMQNAKLRRQLTAAEERGDRYKAEVRRWGGKVSPTGSSSDSSDSPGSPGTPRVELRRQRDEAREQLTAERAAHAQDVAALQRRGARYKARAKKLGGEVSPTGSSSDSSDSPGSPGTPRVELRRQRDALRGQNAFLEEKDRLQGQLLGLAKVPGLGRQIFDLGMRITRATTLGELRDLQAEIAALRTAPKPDDVPLPDDDDGFLA
jgi:hypothetical protein